MIECARTLLYSQDLQRPYASARNINHYSDVNLKLNFKEKERKKARSLTSYKKSDLLHDRSKSTSALDVTC